MKVDRLTENQIGEICKNYDMREKRYQYLPEQVAFAGMAFLGMKRHPEYSPDWLAHNQLWASACNSIGQIIKPTHSGIGINAEADRLIEKIKQVLTV